MITSVSTIWQKRSGMVISNAAIIQLSETLNDFPRLSKDVAYSGSIMNFANLKRNYWRACCHHSAQNVNVVSTIPWRGGLTLLRRTWVTWALKPSSKYGTGVTIGFYRIKLFPQTTATRWPQSETSKKLNYLVEVSHEKVHNREWRSSTLSKTRFQVEFARFSVNEYFAYLFKYYTFMRLINSSEISFAC